MAQITTDSAESAVPAHSWRIALRNLGIGLIVAAALALIASFLLMPVAVTAAAPEAVSSVAT